MTITTNRVVPSAARAASSAAEASLATPFPRSRGSIQLSKISRVAVGQAEPDPKVVRLDPPYVAHHGDDTAVTQEPKQRRHGRPRQELAGPSLAARRGHRKAFEPVLERRAHGAARPSLIETAAQPAGSGGSAARSRHNELVRITVPLSGPRCKPTRTTTAASSNARSAKCSARTEAPLEALAGLGDMSRIDLRPRACHLPRTRVRELNEPSRSASGPAPASSAPRCRRPGTDSASSRSLVTARRPWGVSSRWDTRSRNRVPRRAPARRIAAVGVDLAGGRRLRRRRPCASRSQLRRRPGLLVSSRARRRDTRGTGIDSHHRRPPHRDRRFAGRPRARSGRAPARDCPL